MRRGCEWRRDRVCGFDIVLRVKKDSRVLFLNVMMEIKQGKSVTVLLVSFHALLFGWFLFFNINL